MPTLVEWLREATTLDLDPPRQDAAERLGLWLNAADSITLHAALQAGGEVQRKPAAARPAELAAVQQDVERTRRELETSLLATLERQVSEHLEAHQDAVPSARGPGASPAAVDASYLEQQRRMSSQVRALRSRVRLAVAKSSPALRQLATLDAVMERALAGREQPLLGLVPMLLQRRVERALAEPEASPEAIIRQCQAFLLAELELRLEPVVGLIEAFSNHTHTHP
jgi:hypothetical protein